MLSQLAKFIAFILHDKISLSVAGSSITWITANLILANDILKVLISLGTLWFLVYRWLKERGKK